MGRILRLPLLIAGVALLSACTQQPVETVGSTPVAAASGDRVTIGDASVRLPQGLALREVAASPSDVSRRTFLGNGLRLELSYGIHGSITPEDANTVEAQPLAVGPWSGRYARYAFPAGDSPEGFTKATKAILFHDDYAANPRARRFLVEAYCAPMGDCDVALAIARTVEFR
jgi:hypothetical protein